LRSTATNTSQGVCEGCRSGVSAYRASGYRGRRGNSSRRTYTHNSVKRQSTFDKYSKAVRIQDNATIYGEVVVIHIGGKRSVCTNYNVTIAAIAVHNVCSKALLALLVHAANAVI